MSAETEWPEGVVARYLTVGGATVDLVHDRNPDDVRGMATVATCNGCGGSEVVSHCQTAYTVRAGSGPRSDNVHNPDAANEKARDWAQSHAETCRAMPNPGVES